MKKYPRRLGWFTKVYATSDGRAFTSLYKAESHQDELNAQKFLEALRYRIYQYAFEKPEDYYVFIKALKLGSVQDAISSILRSNS